MLKKSRFHSGCRRTGARLIVVALLFMLLSSCGSREGLVGAYKAEPTDSAKQVEASLELKANGDGVWRVGDEEVPFSWYMKNGELRVNTKGGGVLVGAVESGAIRISLPGTGTMAFKKCQ